jgi:ferric-dicitrate binding protein FerR (iron transport regulator)
MNDLTPQEQQRLTEKKLKGTITPAEDALLEAWYAKEPGPQMLWESDDPDRETLKNRVFFQISQGAGLHGQSGLLRRRIGRLSAAASIIVVFGIGGYWLFRNHSRPAETVVAKQPPSQDVSPGHAGAILTLADGSHIVLDSAGNGRIAVQGATHLVKNNNGQLVYQAGKGVPGTVTYNTLTTPRGRQYTVVLPDGTSVWLNAASSLTYPTAFTGSQRKVEITGEAYFEVAKDPALPFKVKINNATEVEVLGTHFNVSAYSDEDAIRTTLLEGAVNVNEGQETVRLHPGEQLKINNSDGASRVINDVDVDGVIAWKNGVFQFGQADIRTMMRQLARWYDVEVSYTGKIEERHLGGFISRNVTLSNVVKALDAYHVHCRIEGKKLIVQE